MKAIVLAVAGLTLVASTVQAAETLDAATVKQLITGKTAHGLIPSGGKPKNYFSPDGKLYRFIGGKVLEGTWRVHDDGTQCVDGLSGGCARIVRNDDGTYSRVLANGKVSLKWLKFVDGRDF